MNNYYTNDKMVPSKCPWMKRFGKKYFDSFVTYRLQNDLMNSFQKYSTE